MSPASKPPVLGQTAAQTRGWVDELITEAARLLLEGDEDEREQILARLSIARFLELHVREVQKRLAVQAQQAGASNESLAYALGVRPQTVATRFPSPHRARRNQIAAQWAAGGNGGSDS